MKYEYKTCAAYRGYGWIEPLTDSEDSLIEDHLARRICEELNTLQAEVEALRAEVEAWRELSDHVRAGACKAIWPDRYTDERTRDVAAALKRAERLAELLDQAYGYVPAGTLADQIHCALVRY